MKPRNIILFIISLTLLVACRYEEKNENTDVETEKLFDGTLRLIKIYSDSISLAADTTQVAELFRHFNHNLEKLNFDVVADTDLTLSEQQNDSLYSRLTELRSLFERRMRELERSYAISSDSIPVTEAELQEE